MIPYFRPKLSDFYTLSQTELLKSHTLHSGTYIDGISSRMFKLAAPIIAPSIAKLINLSFFFKRVSQSLENCQGNTNLQKWS